MILVDTSVWIDHLHRPESRLVAALRDSQVILHPMIIGELALGSLRDRGQLLHLLGNLPSAHEATQDEILRFVETSRLYGRGLSLVDVHLLASAILTPGTLLWTRDKRMRAMAGEFGIGFDEEGNEDTPDSSAVT